MGVPEGWTTATLAAVTDRVPNVDPGDEPDREFGYVDIASIDNSVFRVVPSGIKRFRGRDAPSRARRPVGVGDVLFSNVRTYLRNTAFLEAGLDAQVCSTGFTVLRANGAAEPRFLFRYVLSDAFVEAVTPHQTGALYPATSDRVVLSQKIPLPPIAEQKRIVASVEELLAHVNAAREPLDRVPAILNRFRQAVLAAACSGRLTEDWRADHSKRGAEPGRSNAASADDLPEIPDEWGWVQLDQLGELARGKSKHRPRDDPRLYGGPYPFIQTGDVARSMGRLTKHSQTYSELGLQQSRLWPARTVCITIAANIADSAILTYPACFPDSVVGLVADESRCVPEYIEFFVRTARQNLAEYAPATAQKNINLEILREVAVPLPPPLEQREIVHRVESLLAIGNEAEQRAAATALRVERLTQAVLAKAFRGELVPTEAELARQEGRDYEPVSVLLARISSQRDTRGVVSQKRRHLMRGRANTR